MIMENEANNTIKGIESLSSSNQDILKEIHEVAKLMDSAFEIPVIKQSFGAEAVAGFVLPGIGDFLTVLPSLYILWRAKVMGVPNDKIVPMFSNIAMDTGVGLIPLAGDLFDFLWKANIKNINIIHAHFNLSPYEPNKKPKQEALNPKVLSLEANAQNIVTTLPKTSLTFEQWLTQNPVLMHFSPEEQKEAYQEYLSQNNP